MPEARNRAASSASSGGGELRLVLFGLPGAGKSALLGALAQAARTQRQILNGCLGEQGQGLAELCQKLYGGAALTTPADGVSYPITFEPLAPEKQQRFSAVLFDGTGQASRDLLAGIEISGPPIRRILGQEVLAADALVLAVAASAGPAEMENAFADFTRFLRWLEDSRGCRADIGGLPVFLVLTKCDLLAQRGDDWSAWIDRIEEGKRQVGRRFREFFAEETGAATGPASGPGPELGAPPEFGAGLPTKFGAGLPTPPTLSAVPGAALPTSPIPPHSVASAVVASFGSIALHFWAVAVKRPALVNSPARPRDPYGVAELFRQCFDHARRFQDRRRRAGRRLLWTAAAAVAAVAGMAILAALFLLTRTSDLEARVENYLLRDQDPRTRFKHLDLKFEELARITLDPAFPRLSEEQRDYVERRSQELSAYRKFQERLKDVPDPKSARTESELQTIKNRLTELESPAVYREEWGQTEAVLRRDVRLEETKAIEAIVNSLEAAYRDLIREGNQVLDNRKEADLPGRAKKVLTKARELPDPNNDHKKISDSQRGIHAAAFQFDKVAALFSAWEKIRDELKPLERLEDRP